MPTSASEWKKKTRLGEEVTLPSGAVARLKRPSIMDMARNGELPNLLAAFAMRGVEGSTSPKEVLNNLSMADTAKEMEKSLRVVCKASFVEPRIVDDPDDPDAITMLDVSDEDQVWVLGWALGADADTLRNFFPDKQGEAVESVPDGTGVPDTSVRDIWSGE